MRIVSCSSKSAAQSIFRAMALLIAGATLGSCGNDNLPKPQKLGPLRVLGLIASNPEIQPGGTSAITAIVSDFNQGGRALSYEWKACVDPGVALGATPTCEGASSVGTPASGTINTTATQLAATPFTGEASNNGFTLGAGDTGAILNGKTSFEKFNGVAILVTFKVSSGSESESAFRRILVRDLTLNPTPLNTKPATPAGIAALPSSEQALTPTISETAASYSVLSTTGDTLTRTEKLTVSWYTTDGEFEFSRTDGASSNKWTPPTSGTAVGLILLRDDRGGLSNPLTIGY